MPDQPYVTFPGTAGNYISSPDTNLLDADTAHFQQSVGQWVNQGNTILSVDTPPSPPPFGSTCLKVVTPATAAAQFAVAGGAATDPAISGNTEYVASFWVYSTVGGKSVAGDLNQYAGTSYRGTVNFSGTTVANQWVHVPSTAFTSAADADNVRIYAKLPEPDAGQEWWVAAVVLRAGSDATFVPSLRIVGDLDTVSRVAADDWLAATTRQIFSRDNGSTNRSYYLRLNPDGQLLGAWFTGSGSRTVTSTTFDPPNLGPIYIRFRATAAGLGTIEQSIDGGTWELVGTQAHAAAALNSASEPLYVGAYNQTSFLWDGAIYETVVRDGIDGPIVAQFDAADVGGVL